MGEKFCNGCERTLPTSEFDYKNREKGWLYSRCKACRREATAARRRARAAEPKPVKVGVPPFPADDFHEFRRLTTAYRSHRTGLYVRPEPSFFHRDMIAKLETERRLLAVLPPAHAKTSTLIDWISWLIMRDETRSFRVAIVAKAEGEASKIVGAIEQRLSDSDWYEFVRSKLRSQGDTAPFVNPITEWFGDRPFKPESRKVGEKWGATAFRVAGALTNEKDPTVVGYGRMGPLQGGRYDLIVCDDMESPRDARNFPQSSVETVHWLEDVALGRISDTQRLCILANSFSDHDMVARMLESHDEFSVVRYPALIPRWLAEGLGEPDDDAPQEMTELVPLWPDYWTPEGLELKRKEVGPRTWSVTWMAEPAGSDETATFKRPMLELARDESLRLGEIPEDVSDIFVGCDPAVAGVCAISAWGYSRKSQRRYLLDLFAQPGLRTWQNVAAKIVETAQPFAASRMLRSVVIEKASQQGSLIDDQELRRSLASLGCKVKPYATRTGTGARAEAENFDITTLGGLFDTQMISLPYGGSHGERERVDAFIDECCAWRLNEDGSSVKHLKRDRLMAVLFAESEAFALAARKRQGPPRRPSHAPQWAQESRVWRQHDPVAEFRRQKRAEAEAAIAVPGEGVA